MDSQPVLSVLRCRPVSFGASDICGEQLWDVSGTMFADIRCTKWLSERTERVRRHWCTRRPATSVNHGNGKGTLLFFECVRGAYGQRTALMA